MKAKTTLLAMALVLLSASTMIAPAAATAAGTISITDLRHLSPDIKFPGSPSFGFRPVTATVKQGSTVTFTNVGQDIHTVTSFHNRTPVPFAPILVEIPDGVFDSSPSIPPFAVEGTNFTDAIQPGQTFTVSTGSLQVGTYTYFCKLHPWMVGALVVSLSGTDGATIRIADTFMPTGQHPFAGSAAWGFLSRTTTVKQGTVVVWTNDGFIQHTVTSAVPGQPEGSAFNSGLAEDPAHWLLPGMTFSVDTSTLQPGAYPYECDIHPWMQGTLIVLG